MNYPVAFELSGPTAMWTRPDTGDAPVSYPAPTSFESIVWASCRPRSWGSL
jgi:CRISPR-associated protein Cas5d